MAKNVIKSNPDFTDGGSMADGEKEIMVDDEIVQDSGDAAGVEEPAETEEDGVELEPAAEEAEEEAPAAEEAEISPEEETVEEEQQMPVLPPEVQALVEKGRRMEAVEKKMPGFDPVELYAEFTRRSQDLARLTKGNGRPVEAPLPTEQMETLKKALQSLGVVTQGEMAQTSVETQKEFFLREHPEYSADGGKDADARWQKLMAKFSEFNWQAHPDKVYAFLSEAHAKISPAQPKAAAPKPASRPAKSGVNPLLSLGGGAARSGGIQKKATAVQGLTSRQREAFERGGWSDAEIAEFERDLSQR